MRKKFIAAIIAAALFGGVAEAETYICSVKPDGHDYGWISKSIAINIDNKTNAVLVRDAIILQLFKKPISGATVRKLGELCDARLENPGGKGC